MRQGLTSIIRVAWVRWHWRRARRRLREYERAWRKVGQRHPPMTHRYMRTLEVELYWRKRLWSVTQSGNL